MNEITFAGNAWAEYLIWQTQDKKTLRRINGLLKEILRHPFEGEGKPEPLKGKLQGKWSRRINDTDRLVYSVSENMLPFISVKDIMKTPDRIYTEET